MKAALSVLSVLILVVVLWQFVDRPEPSCQTTPNHSCFNQLAVNPEDNWSHYRFVVLGHIRSAPGNLVPNKLLLRYVNRIFDEEPAFVVSLGDLYYNLNDEGLVAIKDWVSNNIPVPFFNAVGNHDVLTGGDPLPDGSKTAMGNDVRRYVEEFGDPNYDFRLGSELFIFFDNSGSPILDETSLRRLQALLEYAGADASIRNIFLFSHKVFWSYENPAMEPVFRYRHPVKTPPNYRFFLDELKPLLEPLAESKQIFLVSGDIGGGKKYLQTFFHRDPHITYIATGMGGTPRDSFVTVTVKSGEVSLHNTNFTTGKSRSMEDFGLEYWQTFYRDNPALAAEADQLDKPN